MQECECSKESIIKRLEDTVQTLQIDLAVARSDISTVKEHIKGISDKLDGFAWYFIGLLVSIIGGMTLILLKMKGMG